MRAEPLPISIGSDAAATVRYVLTAPESAIKLDKRDVALLVMAQDRMRRLGAAALTLDDLREMSSVVSQADGGGRVTEMSVKSDVARLLDMRILVRAQSPTRTSDTYRLGPVGREIAEGWHFLPDEETERLDAVLGEACVMLLEMAEKAEGLHTETEKSWPWPDISRRVGKVIGDGLLRSAERRQAQLDRWQATVQAQVRLMLLERWDAAIDICERTLLDSLKAAKEMKECIDRVVPRLHAALQRIAQAAEDVDQETLAAADDVAALVDRITDWTTVRFEEWAQFVDQAMRYIQTVVRADPGRVLSHMLDLQMRAFCEDGDAAVRRGDDDFTPWTIVVSKSAPFIRLRASEQPPPPRLVVRREPPTQVPERDNPWERITDEISAFIGHLLATTGRADLEDVVAPWRNEPIVKLSRIVGIAVRLMAAVGRPVVDPSSIGGPRERVEIAPGLVSDQFTVLRAA
jgi:hypothetical protein